MQGETIQFATAFRWLRGHALRFAPKNNFWNRMFHEERRHHRLALRENTERYRAIVETAIDAINGIRKGWL